MGRYWNPPVELSKEDERVIARCGKRKLFEFLRLHRHELFDVEMQERLLAAYSEHERGKPMVPPAQLAMALLLQAGFNEPDHEVVTLTVDSKRWQMVLDCYGAEKPPFSQGTLFNFRERLIAHGLDQVLLEKTIQLARETAGFSATKLRAAFDASPLRGAGRVEDTFNLIGHAASRVVKTAAKQLGLTSAKVAEEAGIPLAMASSIKAGLDLDWDAPDARTEGLRRLLTQVESLGAWLRATLNDELEEEPLKTQWEEVQALISQDTEPDPDGSGPRIKQGVAKDRRISVSDPDMRHGRKSKATRIDGYKRHLAVDLDLAGLICAVALTPANLSEREASSALLEALERQGVPLGELYIDRGYLGDAAIEARRQAGLRVHCKPFPLRNGAYFSKEQFQLDLQARKVTCPAGVSVPLLPGTSSHFPAKHCNRCDLKQACTRSDHGRSLSIHPLEDFHLELRERRATPEGRKQLRERVKVEHRLAAIGGRQGNRARYLGRRKNLFDLRRHAAVHNLLLVDLWTRAAG
jgi:hypothetical protein